MTRVLLFASLRESAGTAETSSDAATVAALIADLSQRFGEPFATRVTAASVVVDGDPVGRDSRRRLYDASEVALLPPFSGGAASG